jgi:hypothetical protein
VLLAATFLAALLATLVVLVAEVVVVRMVIK